MKNISVYVHIPFCAKKCFYCDFLSFYAEEDTAKLYFAALCDEIRVKSATYASCVVKTIFFGGGTPSFVDSVYILKVLRAICENFAVDSFAEITIECNPESANMQKLREYFDAGFNRLSLGIQSLANNVLTEIGRIHDSVTAQNALKNAEKAGFTNINVDIMFALPKQTHRDLEDTLDIILSEKSVKHVSAYGLILEEGTPLFDKIKETDDETDREMYALIKKRLKNANFEQYEISNFAQKGYECKHNLTYWTGAEYVGFGLGAHSFDGKTRFRNYEKMSEYLKKFDETVTLEVLSVLDKYAEFFILGLRLTKGVSLNDFREKFGVNAEDIYGKKIEEACHEGLIVRKKENVRLTERGLDLANIAMAKFLS